MVSEEVEVNGMADTRRRQVQGVSTVALAMAVAMFGVLGGAARADAQPAFAAARVAPIVFGTAAGIPEIAIRSGSGVTRLTGNAWYEGLPAWSPDRGRIAYVSARDRDADIWVMNADGSGARRLVRARGADDLYPAWSPDGRLIAFSRYRHGGGDIYVVRADGSGLCRLTSTAKGVDNTMPRFSPDGRDVVFASTRRSGAHEIVRIRASDGGGATFLIRGGNSLAPDYSPDGRWIVFVAHEEGTSTLWLMNAGGGGRRLLTRHPRTLSFPRFSPDGRSILYTVAKPADEQTGSHLWRIGVDGSGRVPIGPGAERDW
jgi:TolB protein